MLSCLSVLMCLFFSKTNRLNVFLFKVSNLLIWSRWNWKIDAIPKISFYKWIFILFSSVTTIIDLIICTSLKRSPCLKFIGEQFETFLVINGIFYRASLDIFFVYFLYSFWLQLQIIPLDFFVFWPIFCSLFSIVPLTPHRTSCWDTSKPNSCWNTSKMKLGLPLSDAEVESSSFRS